jgi:hypothetical protein
MKPAIALHESGRFAFSVGEIVLDLSVNNTPPEIAEFFGVDASFLRIKGNGQTQNPLATCQSAQFGKPIQGRE